MTVFHPVISETEYVEAITAKNLKRIIKEHDEKPGHYLITEPRHGKVKIQKLNPSQKIPVDNDRREAVYEATNRILEHTEATNPGGHTSETYHKIEEQVDTILSNIGLPDRIKHQ